ncbi:hypothetical protein SAMN05444123_107114 [Rhodopseudomonas pseudopalustris]|uniref:Uncharacterized protein n=1 Tax=Rhodopseudomonas pseudopalustris TaxID=1513892 RepID=A0A1H8UKV0_9BRAD|nr:hypothetical protein SAMN05444123_107114 [Rhodopseudomonas pseudopalustris]
MDVVDHFVSKNTKDETQRNQLGVMKVHKTGFSPANEIKSALVTVDGAQQSTFRQFSKIVNIGTASPETVAEPIRNDKSDVCVERGMQGLHLLDEDADIIPWMDGRELYQLMFVHRQVKNTL